MRTAIHPPDGRSNPLPVASPPPPRQGVFLSPGTSPNFQTSDRFSDMPSPRQSDNPNALTEYLGIMITKAELAKVQAVMNALGVSKSAAARIVLREGFGTDRVKSFTPQETDES